MNLAGIGEAIQARVEASQDVVISRLFDRLLTNIESKNDVIAEVAARCSYAAVGLYAGLKIDIHHAKRVLDDFQAPKSWYETANERFRVATDRAHRVRVGMYSNVCGQCPACLTRKRPWPPNAVFAEGFPPGVFKMTKLSRHYPPRVYEGAVTPDEIERSRRGNTQRLKSQAVRSMRNAAYAYHRRYGEGFATFWRRIEIRNPIDYNAFADNPEAFAELIASLDEERGAPPQSLRQLQRRAVRAHWEAPKAERLLRSECKDQVALDDLR